MGGGERGGGGEGCVAPAHPPPPPPPPPPPTPTPPAHSWLRFDDGQVSFVSQQAVLSDRPYLLVYQRA